MQQQTQDIPSDNSRYILQVYVGALSLHYEALSVEASKQTTAEEIVSCIVERLGLLGNNYELAEVAGECKERRLAPEEKPVSVMLLWPMHSDREFHRFYLRETQSDITWLDSYGLDSHIFRDFIPFLLQPENREYPDLCQLPDLNESTLLENLRQRFESGYIYTYVGSILIAVNPFKFYPIYNPKYVRLYQNQRIGPILPPHIFAIADNAYYSMLKEKRNQCIVISGESGSGKTESTNFLLHHLTALSQKGSHGSGVEQTILSAGPVLEAFGNAKTAHNNNSSRFGKFIQVNYRENGMVQGAVVQKYLLEKSRIVSQGPYERNYHVFYYLLSGANELERESLHLLPADKYYYLNSKNLTLENCDEKYEFSRLKQSMEMVGFSSEKQRRLFMVLSAVLLLGNVEFFPKKSTYHHDESVQVRNLDIVSIISELLKVKQDTLLAALTSKRVKASGETLIMQYKLPEAIAARDALAKCLYGALFDWIVLQVNHALLNKDQTPHTGHSIGVLDIFGFEDFGTQNSFEQFCINYANEHLQYYFNLHVFKYEQNEYKREGIKWRDIEFMDNSGCLHLFESKPTGLLCILDDLCNFPGATNETLLQKFNSVHKDNKFYEKPQRKENAFIIRHYAGKVKYQVAEMREKNLDLMRQDIVSVLKNSSMAFVRELVGADPVAVFRWAIIRAFFRSYFAFRNAGVKHRKERNDYALNKIPGKHRFRQHNDMILSKKSNANELSSQITNQQYHHNYQQHQYQQQQQQQQYQSQQLLNNYNRNTKRSWSSIAFNNKNFPDGKISYETNSNNTNNNNSNSSNNNSTSSLSLSNSLYQNNENRLFSKNFSKFEHLSQDVMVRASQIVQKNKSFRPRERPKKGLKNLQTVKMMTAGTNCINQTGIKTRKQPLTVTAQFQNSLSALMDTLNQANPFFIRCIKSNSQKIPNKFDDATVVRQLRYTGMLETVRIRRAGYNVRLTYEEFIQLYRILLPKGLVSSQKDVKDFLNTMDLNKQHYQLGTTKIYMRESQKMRLDIKLHTKIIDSIVLIQRWFRGILQRRRYLLLRSAAITIQSYWRMYMTQKHLNHNKLQYNAASIIQATWKMYKINKWYKKLKITTIIFQAHIRGYLAREKYEILKQKIQKERNRLRSTQSLPNEERIFKEYYQPDEVKRAFQRPHHSLDLNVDDKTFLRRQQQQQQQQQQSIAIPHQNKDNNNSSGRSSNNKFLDSQNNDVLQKAGNQLRSLMISSSSSSSATSGNPRSYSCTSENYLHHKTQIDPSSLSSSSLSLLTVAASATKSQQQQQSFQTLVENNDRIKISTKDNDNNRYYDDISEIFKRNESTKPPVRRTDSGPPLRYDYNYEDISNVPKKLIPDHTTIIAAATTTNTTTTTVTTNVSTGIPTIAYARKDYYNNQQLTSSTKGNENFSDILLSRRDRSNPSDTMNSSSYQKHYENMMVMGSSGQDSGMQQQQQQQQSYNQQNVHHQKSSYAKQVQSLDESYLSTTITTTTTTNCRIATPRGKAAALLGSISEDKGQQYMSLSNRLQKQQGYKGRRVKSNLSDDIATSTTTSSNVNTTISLSHVVPKSSIEYTTTTTSSSCDSLKRRNSDPSTNKVPLLEVNRGNDMYQSSTQINIAGHRFRKAARIGKAEKCASCQESDAFVNEGHRCLDCKVLVHTKCIQNGGVKTLICEAKRSKRLRNKNNEKSSYTPNSKYSGTREYTDSTDRIISDAKELNLMHDFITQKIYKMDESEGDKSSEVDRVFKQALRAFKDNLVTQYSVAHKQNSDSLNIKYRDLIDNFGQVMETCCGKKDDFPLTMGVNAFRGFMNEFMNSRENEKPKAKRKKDKKRKIEEHTNFNGHTFQLTIINIPTACEICQLFLLWPIERGLVCQNCRLTCHKKCYHKALSCNKVSPTTQSNNSSNIIGGLSSEQQNMMQIESKLFGVPLTTLCLIEGSKIPIQIEQLITKIEMLGLYSEGIYRKSGVNSKIKELKIKMSEHSSNTLGAEIDYESYNVHVLANVLKSFLRDMPEPLLTFDRYDDFLRASDLPDTNIRVQTLLSLIKKLPSAHHFLLERLIFHLALVAQREKHNRMSASSLAIVFAPCVLRTNRLVPAQDSLNDIGRQTKCIETLITQKMLNVKNTLADIDTLDTAAHTATTRLSTLRSSKVFSPDELTTSSRQPPINQECETEEMILEGHIQEIKKEKALLTSTLPNLVRATSDDDLLSTDLEGEGGSLDDLSTGGGGKDCCHSLVECKELKNSIDSSLGSLSDNISLNRKMLIDHQNDPSTASTSASRDNLYNYDIDSVGGNDSIALSYNLRDQNIDYISSPSSRHQSSSTSSITIDQQQQDVLSKIQSSVSTSVPSYSTPKQSSISRWSGSQQNINVSPSSSTSAAASVAAAAYSAATGSCSIASSSGSGSGSGSGIQITSGGKPIAIRSMSGGYEQQQHHHSHHHHLHHHHNSPKILSTQSFINSQQQQQQHSTLVSNTTTISNKSSINKTDDNKSSNRQGKKKQGSLDDEPIMV